MQLLHASSENVTDSKPRRCLHMGMRISAQQGREGTLHTNRAHHKGVHVDLVVST